jgi:hypothetical protein
MQGEVEPPEPDEEETIGELIAEEEDPQERERLAELFRQLHSRNSSPDGSDQ